jgi:uncharacterized Zn-binding protein involved in type VI secretion
MATPGTPPVPHVGGPILPACEPTVLIGFLPAARVTDLALCVGPTDSIAMGSPTVLIGGLMAARLGDPTVHGGVIVQGCPTVIIGEVGAGSPLSVDAGSGVELDASSEGAGRSGVPPPGGGTGSEFLWTPLGTAGPHRPRGKPPGAGPAASR